MNKELEIRDTIGNWKLEIGNSRQRAGFTLVEILAVLFIFAIVGSIIAQILFTALRTSKKADANDVVKQNGNFAITQIAKTLRDARGIAVYPYPCGAPDSPTATSSVTTTGSDGNNVKLWCTTSQDSPASTIASDAASLLDSSSLAVSSCSFTCSQVSASDLPIISVNFSLTPKNANTTETTASGSGVLFSTSVSLRNIIR